LRKLLPSSISLWVGGDGIKGIPSMPSGIQLFNNLGQISAALQKSAEIRRGLQ